MHGRAWGGPQPTAARLHLPGGPAREPPAEPHQHQNRDITIRSWLLGYAKQVGLG